MWRLLPAAATEAVTDESFDETIDTNFKGAYFIIRQALPLLSEGASVILDTSISAHIGGADHQRLCGGKGGVRHAGAHDGVKAILEVRVYRLVEGHELQG